MEHSLSLEHLAPYLPYDLQIQVGQSSVATLTASKIDWAFIPIDSVLSNHTGWQPILRPLSQLTEEIEHNGETFTPMSESDPSPLDYGDLSFESFNGREVVHWNTPYITMQLLFKWHFDVFGLIDRGLAIIKPAKS